MKIAKKLVALASGLALSSLVAAGPYYESAKISSMLFSADEPAMRLSGDIAPTNCDSGKSGWLYFKGTLQQKKDLFDFALSMAEKGLTVTVYTNSDSRRCQVFNIQVAGFDK
jgi:hypothetical protein